MIIVVPHESLTVTINSVKTDLASKEDFATAFNGLNEVARYANGKLLKLLS